MRETDGPEVEAVSGRNRGRQESFPHRGKHASIVWKNRRNRVPWCGKFSEKCFHGVEKCRKWLPLCGKLRGLGGLRASHFSLRANGDKTGFHAVELFPKVGSMPWKNSGIRVPCRGKRAKVGSMVWKTSRTLRTSREPFSPLDATRCYTPGRWEARLPAARGGREADGKSVLFVGSCRFSGGGRAGVLL